MKMTAMLLFALGVLALLRHRSAALRHWVLAAAIACAAAMPLLESIMPAWPLPMGSAPRATAAQSPELQAGASTTTIEYTIPGTRVAATAASRPARAAIRFVWYGGMLISFGILLAGLGRLAWLAGGSRRLTEGRWIDMANEVAREYGIRRPFVLLQSDHPSLLVTWGLALPKIILPSAARDWPDERARVVLSHELAHIRRGDWTVQIAAELLRGVYWFNPLLWIFCRRLRLESEHACDDEVMNRGMVGADYATHLLELARALNQQRHTWFPAPAMARPSSLERRVRAMLNDRLNRQPISGRTRAAIFVLLFSATAAVAAAQSMFQTFSGTVVDPSGRPVPGVAVVLTNAQREAKYEVKSNGVGAFEFVGLLSGDYTLEARVPGFATLKDSVSLAGKNVERHLSLRLGELQETIVVTFGDEGRDEPVKEPVVKEKAVPEPRPCPDLAVGGNILAPKKIKDVAPQYPPNLRGTGIQGAVVMAGRIGLDGYINSIQVLGDAQPDLAAAAVAAVREWRFTQTLLNCAPVEVALTITTNFKPMPPPPPPAPRP